MSHDRAVIRVEPNGPKITGLTPWDSMDPENLVEGTPVQRGHIYHENPDAGIMVGVWDCTAFTEHMAPYPVDEFMYLLEGTLRIGLPDGTDVVVGRGQAFVIPKGFVCQWKQAGYVRKIFMIADDPRKDTVFNPSLSRITVSMLVGVKLPEAVASSFTEFISASGRMRMTTEGHGRHRTTMVSLNETRLIHVLGGKLIIEDMAGEVEFKSGQTACIVARKPFIWETAARTRLVIASHVGT